MTEKAKAVVDLESPVFEGTDEPMMAFVDWMMDGGRVSTFLVTILMSQISTSDKVKLRIGTIRVMTYHSSLNTASPSLINYPSKLISTIITSKVI